MASATITSKGQMTIPRDVRRHVGLLKGDVVTVHAVGEGAIVVRRKRPMARQLAGMLAHRKGRRAPTPAEIDRAFADAASERWARAARRR